MKIIYILLTTIILLAGFVTSVNAAGLSTRIEQPRSPVSTKNFQVDFVALDIEGRSVSVECFMKGPGGAFTEFDSKSLIAGGSSGVCQVNESDMATIGTYEFYVKAIADSDTQFSPTVSVNFDDKSPGTPTNYTRETINSCDYRIKFRTAPDGGLTNKVFLYRSDQSSYSADNSTKVAVLGVGSDANGEFINTVPDCNKKYYYSIRAFSSSGTGSGITGDPDAVVLGTFTGAPTDSVVRAKVSNTNPVAINIALGEGDARPQFGQQRDYLEKDPQVLGDEDVESGTSEIIDPANNTTTWIIVLISTVVILLVIFASYLIHKYGNK